MEEELNKGLTLLKKGQKGLVHAVFSRMGLILLLLVLHVLLLFSAFRWFENFLPHIYGGAVIFTVGMVLYLLNSRMDPSAKITWLIVVMLLPVFGALLFWYTQSDIGHRALKDRLNRLIAQTRDSIPQSAQVMERLEKEEPGAAALAGPLYRPDRMLPGLRQDRSDLLPSGGRQVGRDAAAAGAGPAFHLPGILHRG